MSGNQTIKTVKDFLKSKSNSFDTQMRRNTYYEDTVKGICKISYKIIS